MTWAETGPNWDIELGLENDQENTTQQPSSVGGQLPTEDKQVNPWLDSKEQSIDGGWQPPEEVGKAKLETRETKLPTKM